MAKCINNECPLLSCAMKHLGSQDGKFGLYSIKLTDSSVSEILCLFFVIFLFLIFKMCAVTFLSCWYAGLQQQCFFLIYCFQTAVDQKKQMYSIQNYLQSSILERQHCIGMKNKDLKSECLGNNFTSATHQSSRLSIQLFPGW